MKRPFLLTAPTLLWAAASAFGQGAATPTFEVATVRPSAPLTMELLMSGKAHTGRKVDKAYADYGSTSLKLLIAEAYRVKPFEIIGEDWIKSANFDVRGKLPEGASTDSVPEMLQALLVDRFHLKAHRETKEMSAYALVVGKAGSKLTPASADSFQNHAKDVMPWTIEGYAQILSSVAERPVLDETGLKGLYLLPLFAVMHAATPRGEGARAPEAAAGSGADPAVTSAAEAADPDFSAALVGGLKLEPRKAKMSVLVIDHVDTTPTAN